MNKIGFFLLVIIFLAAFIFRLYKFNNPIADWHSWRQADTSAVSRNFVNFGFDLLHPRFDDLSNVPSGLDNPNGYRFVEFPLYNLAQAGFYKIFNYFSLEESGRLVTIFSSLFSGLIIYLLVKKYAGEISALISLFFFAFLPFNIYYSRTILPDTSMVTAMLGGIFFFDAWLSEKKISVLNYKFLLALIFTASALLLKPYAIFFTLPIIYLAFKEFKFNFVIKWQLWFFLILSILPLILWRVWMLQFPEGIPVNDWLFNAGNIRFKGAFFYWIFGERIAKLILGYWALPLLILGFLAATKKNFLKIKEGGIFFFSFLLSSLIYLFVIARGNVQHDYYQILIIPTLVIFLGLGGEFLLKSSDDNISKIFSYFIFIICVFFTLSFSWYFIRDYFNINNPSLISGGLAVDRLTAKNAKIIALYDGDTSFLYQTKRKGWASFEKPLPEMIKMGANYLVLINPTEKDLKGFGKEFKIFALDKNYLILDLSTRL